MLKDKKISECIKCGRCCGAIPLHKMLYDKLKHHAQVEHVVKQITRTIVIPLTEDCMCIFLKRASKQCAVYEERPQVCKMFGEVPQGLLSCSIRLGEVSGKELLAEAITDKYKV